MGSAAGPDFAKSRKYEINPPDEVFAETLYEKPMLMRVRPPRESANQAWEPIGKKGPALRH